jgi:hypothetical protein
LKLLEACQIVALKSDLRPRRRQIYFEIPLYRGFRTSRAACAALPVARRVIDPVIARGSGDLPDKVFLSRRGTRALENEDEVIAHLAQRGYRTIFPEDLPVPDQLRLFHEAREIVAIHGAGLAPMIYTRPDGPLRQLIEILPCGHMTDNFRGLAHLTGLRWIGVQGRMKPEYMPGIYKLDEPFLSHSLDNFHVDPVSLDMAFDMVGGPGPTL